MSGTKLSFPIPACSVLILATGLLFSNRLPETTIGIPFPLTALKAKTFLRPDIRFPPSGKRSKYTSVFPLAFISAFWICCCSNFEII
ncbi:hypothetical protein [Zhouia amylolytica]|uniref:hypothetical protein n=1 Tax=Zhouia amylolytica TaxID=376730 RepID=UPI000570C5A7|nr:hypothetical protein [Zhouia amylolytica]